MLAQKPVQRSSVLDRFNLGFKTTLEQDALFLTLTDRVDGLAIDNILDIIIYILEVRTA